MGVTEIVVKEGENIDVKCGSSNMEFEINTKCCAVMVSEMDPIGWDDQTQGVVALIQCTKSTSTLAIIQIRGTMGVESIREDIARKLESDAKELIISRTNQVDMGSNSNETQDGMFVQMDAKFQVQFKGELSATKAIAELVEGDDLYDFRLLLMEKVDHFRAFYKAEKEVASQRILVTEEADGCMIKQPLLVLVVDEKFYKNGRESKILDHVSYGIQVVTAMKEIIETMGMSFVGIRVDNLNISMKSGVWNHIIMDRSILKSLECSMARKHILTVVNGDECFVEPPPKSLQSLILKSVKNVVMNQFVEPMNDSKEVDMTKNMVVFSVERELVNFTEPLFEDTVVIFVAGQLDKKNVVASQKLKVHGGHNFRMYVRQLQVVVSRGIIHDGLVVVQYDLSSRPLMFSDALTEDKVISNAEKGVRSLFTPEVFESLGTIALDSQFLEPDGLCPNHNPNLDVQSSKAFDPGRKTILSEATNMIGHGFNFDMDHKLTTLLLTYISHRGTAHDFLGLASIVDLFNLKSDDIRTQQYFDPISSSLSPYRVLATPSMPSWNLTTYQSVEAFNPDAVPTHLDIDDRIVFPIFCNCKCPNETQIRNGMNYLVTYVFQLFDTLSEVTSRFWVRTHDIIDINGELL
ncbi:hypothetical protein V6N11_064398 [Hibiscus sabdariffa]|uniref:Uncharacterized protein n=1 Tax=Hibiscus sabdariffa TaxID=183260 RepID=A0ABR2PNW8_9ROSI